MEFEEFRAEFGNEFDLPQDFSTMFTTNLDWTFPLCSRRREASEKFLSTTTSALQSTESIWASCLGYDFLVLVEFKCVCPPFPLWNTSILPVNSFFFIEIYDDCDYPFQTLTEGGCKLESFSAKFEGRTVDQFLNACFEITIVYHSRDGRLELTSPPEKLHPVEKDKIAIRCEWCLIGNR